MVACGEGVNQSSGGDTEMGEWGTAPFPSNLASNTTTFHLPASLEPDQVVTLLVADFSSVISVLPL